MRLLKANVFHGLAAVLQSICFAASSPLTAKVPFSSHIAPIIYKHCAPCHPEGQYAPFNLVTYQDVKKRSKHIMEAVEGGLMPPWLAEPGYGHFSNERRLTAEEVSLLRRWIADGAPEGDPKKAPAPPQWLSGWAEGAPDLVVTMEKSYHLGAEGPDVYRHFVIPAPLDRDRLVRAVEFSPGNRKIVHHAFIRVDEERQERRREGLDGEPGFTNMTSAAQTPGGQFLTWNPGTRPIVSQPGLAWKLRKNSDLVVEMHLFRTGKPETIQSSVGLYFTNEQPTNTCFTFKLGSFALDFPAGARNEIVRDSLVLPVDVDLLAVYPHAHFLGRQMQAYAIRPNGMKEWLIWIKKWDFNWQGDYRYANPVHLPKGTTIHLEYSYDNSTNNLVNPNHPPKEVLYGERSTDEMCELGLQVLASQTNELKVLQQTAMFHRGALMEEHYKKRLAKNPDDSEALTRLGIVLWDQKGPKEALIPLERAIQLRPDSAEARYNLGYFLRYNSQPERARQELEAALRLDPRYPKAHQQLGFTFAALGNAAGAERNLEKAVELDPADAVAQAGLEELRQLLKARRGTAP